MTKSRNCAAAQRGVRGLGLLIAISLTFTGCSRPERLAAVPRDDTTLAQIAGIPNARYFPDTQIDLMAQETLAARNREVAFLAQGGRRGPLPATDTSWLYPAGAPTARSVRDC